jgi:hypothetical protein
MHTILLSVLHSKKNENKRAISSQVSGATYVKALRVCSTFLSHFCVSPLLSALPFCTPVITLVTITVLNENTVKERRGCTRRGRRRIPRLGLCPRALWGCPQPLAKHGLGS